MTSRMFTRAFTKRALTGGAALGAAGLAANQYRSNGNFNATEAEIQFNTSFGHIVNGQQMIKPPEGWTGRLFQIKNDYPKPPKTEDNFNTQGLPPMPGPDLPLPILNPVDDAPWLKYDFKKDHQEYVQAVKEYCWEGNVNNKFVIQNNPIRNWYHAPWMHWNNNGREPLNGLTFERVTPVGELAKTQTRQLQNWAIGFYNAAGVLKALSLYSC
jgi:hypothetical protein